jgi:hypothetical protein
VGGAFEAVQIGRIEQDDLWSAPREALTGTAAFNEMPNRIFPIRNDGTCLKQFGPYKMVEPRCPCICISIWYREGMCTGSRTCKLMERPSIACHDYNGLKLRPSMRVRIERHQQGKNHRCARGAI